MQSMPNTDKPTPVFTCHLRPDKDPTKGQRAIPAGVRGKRQQTPHVRNRKILLR